MIKETEVRTIRISYECDNCEVGEMIFTGKEKNEIVHTDYEHHCRNCGKVMNIRDQKFPRIEYVEKF